MLLILLLLFAIGFVCGLRSMTPIAAICWAAHLGWINLHGSHLAFLGSAVAVAIFTLAAAGEYVADQLPNTPARTQPGPLGARIVMGAVCGAALAIGGMESLALGIALGIIGAVIGAFSGYQARTRSVKALKVPDFVIATLEDAIAIGAALLIASHLYCL